MRLPVTLAIALCLAACPDKRPELIVTGVELGDVGKHDHPTYRAQVAIGGLCPHEVTVAWSAQKNQVTGASLRLERRTQTSNVTGKAELEGVGPDQSYAQLTTTCLDNDDESSSIAVTRIELFADGTTDVSKPYCPEGMKRCDPKAVVTPQ